MHLNPPASPSVEAGLVSVVIPARNAAAVVVEALNSLRAQTYARFEAIVVDDGSQDDTPAIVSAICGADPRISLVRRPHGGPAAARNAARETARGEFVAFLDADDVWLPEKLERQTALFGADPRTNLVFANYHVWDGQKDLSLGYPPDEPLPEGDSMHSLLRRNVFVTSTVAVRREALDAAGWFDPEFFVAEDWDVWLRLGERGLFARGSREPLVRYRRWPGNVTGDRLKMAESDLRLFEKRLHAAPRPELWRQYRRSVALARSNLEFVRVRRTLDSAPDSLPPAVLRAWRHYPVRCKWLLWYLGAVWPRFLGGRFTAAAVRRKLCEKW